MEKVLVTGGSGFIGLHCIQQLLDQGYDVRCTVRSESKKQEIVESMTKHSSNVNKLEVVMADLLKDEGWNEAALKAFNKKFKAGIGEDFKEQNKQKAFLQNRGFSFQEIDSVFN